MGKIAIVVNPNSGKDIRRLMTHATVFANSEKINILRRIISTIYRFGQHEIYIIPDRSDLARRALDGLKLPKLQALVVIPDLRVTDKQEDTVDFIRQMTSKETCVDVAIVMGGDGTCRAAAKSIGDTPLIALSTGTNNVYPNIFEGTTVGMAAAAIAAKVVSPAEIRKGKRIDIRVHRNIEHSEVLIHEDIALIDVALSTKPYTGARALLEERDIKSLFVTQAHPASIGFSALAGSVHILKQTDDQGLFLKFDWERTAFTAAISAGVFVGFDVSEKRLVSFDETIDFVAEYNGTLALDGEREITFREGDHIALSIGRNGPRKVDIIQVIESAWNLGFFGS